MPRYRSAILLPRCYLDDDVYSTRSLRHARGPARRELDFCLRHARLASGYIGGVAKTLARELLGDAGLIELGAAVGLGGEVEGLLALARLVAGSDLGSVDAVVVDLVIAAY